MSNDGGGTDDTRGRLVGGRYRLIERIGSGGTGTVWRARDELAQREVAVRQPRLPGDPDDESYRRAAHRLHREARAAARVDHPAAVAIHDVVVEAEQRDERPGPIGPDELDAAEALDGLPWIVMELVPGESLQARLRRGPVDVPEAARIGLAVLGALRAAHSVGIVHRDVKPAHVLLGPHRRVVVTDFGIAHVQGEDLPTASGESAAGALEFVAPERMTGRIAGPASDLWSLGALLYAAVEGSSPFLRSTPEATLAAILAAEPPEPPEPARAGPLGPLIARLLVPDPGRRPDAEEVAKELEAVAGPTPAGAIPKPDDQTAPQPGQVSGAESAAALAAQSGPVSGAASGPEFAAQSGPGTGALPGPALAARPGQVSGAESAAALAAQSGPVSAAAPSASGPATPSTPGPAAQPRPLSATPPAPQAQHDPIPPKRQSLFRPGPLALLSALLAGGIGAVTQLADTSSAESAGQAADATDDWSPHPEPDMAAVLHLPRHYHPLGRTGSAAVQPRTVLYGDERTGTIQVGLLSWDRAPASPMDQAGEVPGAGGETRYTRTGFQGHEAALADTTYRRGEVTRRLMRLVIRTDDDRMYELRADMPEGTPEEEEGTSVFEGARDRLGIVKG
ncbi:serine/threonine protein kinase [Streptomyces variegatus]|uniref:non-specific serine/threonine protein kinase n=1 Tax=Streptomyces variegatus TaxID=284040 RepID=A0A0M2GYU8_9ACTN|nr:MULTISPECIES: serine/threonine-protein kinase [Streptomyces]KJK40890.1 serine/threonine protein kinase [Streptomyces variegatus]